MDSHVDHNHPVFQREARRAAAPTRGQRNLRLGIMAVILLVVFGGLYGFQRFREHATAQFFATMKPPPATVSMQPVRVASLPQYLEGIGSVTAVRQVTVSPEVAGRVTQILFQPGAAVHAGDPLVQLNDEPEQGDLANFRAQARLAEISLRRAKELAERQNGPQATVDAMQSQLDQANAGIAKMQALIAQKLVRAPFTGVLGLRQVNLGQYLAVGAPLVTLTDLDTVFVDFTLPEQQTAAAKLGQPVELRVDAYPDRTFIGRITTIEPQLSSDTRTLKLQATIDNPEHILLPGMFAHARIVLPPRPDVLMVPETAVSYSLYGDAVFVAQKAEKTAPAGQKSGSGDPASGAEVSYTAKRVAVKTGEHLGNDVAILAGLNPGDQVITVGQTKLSDGMPIQPVGTALAPPSVTPTY